MDIFLWKASQNPIHFKEKGVRSGGKFAFPFVICKMSSLRHWSKIKQDFNAGLGWFVVL
jgi:hypothetical protein